MFSQIIADVPGQPLGLHLWCGDGCGDSWSLGIVVLARELPLLMRLYGIR